jgi:hypothetical protein
MSAVKFRADDNMHIASFPFVEGKNYEKRDSVNSFSDQCLSNCVAGEMWWRWIHGWQGQGRMG